MGNMQLPRPKDINFPESQEKTWKASVPSKSDGKENKFAQSICLLKSGNILINYFETNSKKFKLRNCLDILSIPDFELVQRYIFDKEKEDTTYITTFAYQSKKGDIFTICDKLYIFDGEKISKGPKSESLKLNDVDVYSREIDFYEPLDIFKKRPIYKTFKHFPCDFILEAKEGKFIYTFTEFSSRSAIFLLDISFPKVGHEMLFSYKREKSKDNRNYGLDIIQFSEYNPENIYIIGNMDLPEGKGFESVLLYINVDELLSLTKEKKEPLFTVEVSKSQRMYGLCEYNEKFILLDSYKNGIYIIDIEKKQKVAVSVPEFYGEGLTGLNKSMINHDFYADRKAGKGFLYRKIIKLRDGQILVEGKIVNIREQKMKESFKANFSKFVISGDSYIFLCPDTTVLLIKLVEA